MGVTRDATHGTPQVPHMSLYVNLLRVQRRSADKGVSEILGVHNCTTLTQAR